MTGESTRYRRFLFVGGLVGALTLGAAGCGTTQDKQEGVGLKYSVDTFTYDSAKDVGRVRATEVIQGQATNQQAEKSMEELLESSAYEVSVYFPDVPADIRAGKFVCDVVKHRKGGDDYTFDCTVTPADSSELPTV